MIKIEVHTKGDSMCIKSEHDLLIDLIVIHNQKEKEKKKEKKCT